MQCARMVWSSGPPVCSLRWSQLQVAEAGGAHRRSAHSWAWVCVYVCECVCECLCEQQRQVAVSGITGRSADWALSAALRVRQQDGAQVSGQQPISTQHHLPRADKREEKEILLLAAAGCCCLQVPLVNLYFETFSVLTRSNSEALSIAVVEWSGNKTQQARGYFGCLFKKEEILFVCYCWCETSVPESNSNTTGELLYFLLHHIYPIYVRFISTFMFLGE